MARNTLVHKNAIVQILSTGGVGVMPTDTIYGVVGKALDPSVVRKIYKIRKRKPQKPFIVLIGSIAQLKLFGINLDVLSKKVIKQYWPGATSIILPCSQKKLVYLHRDTKTLAFRLPKDEELRKFLKETGPLVAPSANTEGKPFARTIKEAQNYFGNKVDFYLDAGRISRKPSALFSLKEDVLKRIR